MANVNTGYLSTNRGIIKIAQIIIGFIISGILCASWIGGRSCFGEGRLGFASGLNFVFVIINIVVFILNFLSLASYKLEQIISLVATILFLVASVLLVWYVIEYSVEHTRLIIATVLIIVQFLLFLYDLKILRGEASN
ncbi:hypothetical protein M3Y97_01012500 [Aphelenchoides bicaudatus]|nr:hypothetical protein M3Y97_01012500 [Aphelenchoides bicaudatus]